MATKTSVASRCAVCRKSDVVLQKCGSCKVVQFCGETCQRAGWKEHKPFCLLARDPEYARSTGSLSRTAAQALRCFDHLGVGLHPLQQAVCRDLENLVSSFERGVIFETEWSKKCMCSRSDGHRVKLDRNDWMEFDGKEACLREFAISGLCMSCQETTFVDVDDETPGTTLDNGKKRQQYVDDTSIRPKEIPLVELAAAPLEKIDEIVRANDEVAELRRRIEEAKALIEEEQKAKVALMEEAAKRKELMKPESAGAQSSVGRGVSVIVDDELQDLPSFDDRFSISVHCRMTLWDDAACTLPVFVKGEIVQVTGFWINQGEGQLVLSDGEVASEAVLPTEKGDGLVFCSGQAGRPVSIPVHRWNSCAANGALVFGCPERDTKRHATVLSKVVIDMREFKQFDSLARAVWLSRVAMLDLDNCSFENLNNYEEMDRLRAADKGDAWVELLAVLTKTARLKKLGVDITTLRSWLDGCRKL